MSKKTVVLTILDGWGEGEEDFSNPIYAVKPKNFSYLKTHYPFLTLEASSISVGLPWGEEGNSEVGHLNLGTGRIVYQNYPKISLSIRKGEFFKNNILNQIVDEAKQRKSIVNLLGLLTEGNVHASIEHLNALIEFFLKNQIKIKLHLISDGRDSSPCSFLELLKKVKFQEGVILASIGGRYYAMDRDAHYERTEVYYRAIIGEGEIISDLSSYIKNTYQNNLNDEYILPVLIDRKENAILDDEVLFFFNFREDRMRQIVSAFVKNDFDKFRVKSFKNLFIGSMVEYDKDFLIPVLFEKEEIKNCLSEVLSKNGKIQFRVAESEKYAHITYFFNGEREEPFENEIRVLIPSTGEVHYDKNPEMRARKITQKAIQAISEKSYDFILINYANADIIAHTGNFEAAKKAIEVLDEEILKLKNAVFENEAILIITSDHGNIERMINPLTGETETKHDISPVPFYLIAKGLEKEISEQEVKEKVRVPAGVLADVAPTILELLKIEKPKEMTGKSLLRFIR